MEHVPPPTSSGIPRLSRLPVPKQSDKSPSNHGRTKYNFKSRLGNPGDALKNASVSQEAEDTSTAKISRSDVKPANDLGSDSKDEAALPGAAPFRAHTLPRRPRPSLSDRTIETLSQVPPSPSPRRRKSGFLPSESPSRPTRSGSSLNGTRPSTSYGHHPPLPSNLYSRPTSPVSRRSISSCHPIATVSPIPVPNGKGHFNPSKAISSTSTNHSPVKIVAGDSPSKLSLRPARASKTLSARPTKPRPTAQDVFMMPSAEPNRTVKHSGDHLEVELPPHTKDVLNIDHEFAPSSNGSLRKPINDAGSNSTIELSHLTKKSNSSATLRDTIAKAKATRQKAAKMQRNGNTNARNQTEAFPNFEIPDTQSILRNRVASARTDGRLNIAALGLKQIPQEVLNMYSTNLGNGAWYESVDLVRVIAADNELEDLKDTAFPDSPLHSHDDEDEFQGNLFGGLGTLDLHNNHLKVLPIGLRRLERLTTLNLSKNHLENESVSIISQIQSLRELHLANNNIRGTLAIELCNLTNLEVLDLHNNSIETISIILKESCSLRAINIAGNRLETLPFDSLSNLRLIDLDAARNRLSGALLPPGMQEFGTLQSLDVSNNALTSISHNPCLHLPSLQSLNVTENRLNVLPDLSNWTMLLNLTAAGNKLTSLPEGLTSLPELKALDLSRNDIRNVDERLGLMESLTMLRIANNPLRERRFLNMEIEDMKRELKARLLPDSASDIGNEKSENEKQTAIPNETPVNSKTWPVKVGGIVDRSSTKLEKIEYSDIEPVMQSNDIKALILNHNSILKIPEALRILGNSLTRLEMNGNKLSGADSFSSKLALPNLKTLDLSVNAISSLSPLVDNLSAPQLEGMNVSRNRLTTLPPLRKTYPSLASVNVADNTICVLDIEAVHGLQVLDVSGNELSHLDPKIGLLGAEGLRAFSIGGNRFRVPRREIIDKGTETILAWLRSRIPDDDI